MPFETAAQSEISVIIVNYATAALAVEAVESVLSRDHDGQDVDIHVLDNASPGDDADLLRRAHAAGGWGARVTLHLETTNHGFGRGNNLVLRALANRARPPGKVFLLNPDARLDNEAIAILGGFLDRHPEAGGAGARIAKPCGTPVTAAFRFPSLSSEFSDTLAFGPVARLFAGRSVPLSPHSPTRQVDWVAGAAVMFRWEALRAVGGFDADYFLYYEEVDLMKRLAAEGWQVWYVAEAGVIHAEGAATGVRSGREQRRPRPDYWYDSWRLYFTKNHGLGYARGCAIARLLAWQANAVLGMLPGRSAGAPRAFLDGFSRRALRPLFGGRPCGSDGA